MVRDQARSWAQRRGFSLVELLVVLGIIAVLMSLLFPMLSRVRSEARAVTCQSNVRQLCQAVFIYAAANGGKFPPNLDVPAPGQYWCDRERAGGYVARPLPRTGKIGGSVLVCPEDDGQRSYAMNVWASSAVNGSALDLMSPQGRRWQPGVRDSSHMILITEQWSAFGADSSGWFAEPYIGLWGQTAGERFGGGAGLVPQYSAGRFGMVSSELPYVRHRLGTRALPVTEPRGRVSIGYADGHVALKSDQDLVRQDGSSSGDSCWYPGDAQ